MAEHDKIRAMSDRAYCQYLEQMQRPECLGWEAKVASGRFGQAELTAHTKGGEHLGRHRALAEIATMLAAAEPQAAPAQDVAPTDVQPLFWYRPCSDGGYEGPIHNASIGDVRKRSGAWVPLAPVAQPAAQPADARADDELARAKAAINATYDPDYMAGCGSLTRSQDNAS